VAVEALSKAFGRQGAQSGPINACILSHCLLQVEAAIHKSNVDEEKGNHKGVE